MMSCPVSKKVIRPEKTSRRRGDGNELSNHGQIDCSQKADETPLMFALTGLNFNSSNDEILNSHDFHDFRENSFLVLRSNHDRQTHTHHAYVFVWKNSSDNLGVKFENLFRV